MLLEQAVHWCLVLQACAAAPLLHLADGAAVSQARAGGCAGAGACCAVLQVNRGRHHLALRLLLLLLPAAWQAAAC